MSRIASSSRLELGSQAPCARHILILGQAPRDWVFRVQDILDAIAKIHRYVSVVDFDAFENDEEIMDAVAYNLTVIGEAANHTHDEIQKLHPEIPWR